MKQSLRKIVTAAATAKYVFTEEAWKRELACKKHFVQH